MIDQAQAVEADPMERMAQFLEAEDDTEPTEQSAPEPEAEAVEETDEEETSEPEVEEATEVITHNGEDKTVTKTELKELAQQGFDYTQKTQQLAEQRRYLEQQEAAVKYQQQFAAQFTEQIGQVKALEGQLGQWQQVNWQQLATEDPMQYLTMHQQYQEAKETYQNQINHLNQIQNQAQEVQKVQSAQRLQQEAQAMRQAIPEWKNSEKATAEMGEMRHYLEKSGFNDAEVKSITDHRHIVVARKAMLYDKLMTTGQKKVAAAPPTAKPGSSAKPTHAADKTTRQELRRSGSGDLAAKLIERML